METQTKASEFFNRKRILVTGATGVVGFNLVKKLKNYNCEIHINYLNPLDNNLSALDSTVSHHVFDITDSQEINNLPNFDIIYHCSGYGQPQKFTLLPEKTFNLNTLSVISLLKKVKTNGSFIFMSSSEVYADQHWVEDGLLNNEGSPITLNPDNSRNCYILGKFFAEGLLKYSGINHKIIRLCLCYGEGFKNGDKRVLSDFVMKAIDKKRINLLDEGSATRCYIYVNDCVDAVFNITINGSKTLYNIGGDTKISIADLAKKIARQTNAEVILGERKNKLKDSPDEAFVDISRYESEFGKLNKTSLEDGLKNTITWYKKYE